MTEGQADRFALYWWSRLTPMQRVAHHLWLKRVVKGGWFSDDEF